MPEPEEEERVTKRVIVEHTTSSRQNVGVFIAIAVLAIALIAFIVTQMR